MKLHELQDPVSAAREMEELNALMVIADGEYRALRTPEALKKIQDLEAKIVKILRARGKAYGAIHEVLDTKLDLEQIEDTDKITQWVLKLGESTILFEVRWFSKQSCEFYFKDMDSGYNLTGKGNELKIFAACKQLIEWIVKERSPYSITFEADKSEGNGSRDQLYRRFLKRWTPPGYEFSEITDKHSANFFLRKKKVSESLVDEALFEGAPITPMKAREEIRKIAMKLHIVSSELMLRYKKRLTRFANNAAKAVSQLELDMNLTKGTLKGFDTLYSTATA